METKPKRKLLQYSEDNVKKALAEVRDGKAQREVCRKYGIPRATLQDRIKGRVRETNLRRMGPDPYLSLENENKISKWLIDLAKCGFPLKKQELLDSVQKIVQKEKIKTPFKEGRPGQTWYLSFLKRHPELACRTPEPIDKSRATLTEEYIRSWFEGFKNFLTNMNSQDILDDPSRLINGDESGFSLCPKTGKVLCLKGGKNIYEVKRGNEKENLTVLVTFTADGRLCPPVVIFPYVRPPYAVVKSVPEHWILGKSDTGWMRSDIFFEFVANGLNDWLIKEQIKKPVIFLVDGHRSHMSLDLSTFCYENGIILYALPPNATHLLQPADVAVFKPLKSYWKEEVRRWQNEPDHFNMAVTKTEFCLIFEKALTRPEMSHNMRRGFQKCGLFPFNPNAVDYTKCVQNVLEKLNTEAEESDQWTHLCIQDIKTTEKVIVSMKQALSKRGVDTHIILDELKLVESKIPSSVPLQEQTNNMIEYEITADGFLNRIEDNVHILELPVNNIGNKNILELTQKEKNGKHEIATKMIENEDAFLDIPKNNTPKINVLQNTLLGPETETGHKAPQRHLLETDPAKIAEFQTSNSNTDVILTNTDPKHAAVIEKTAKNNDVKTYKNGKPKNTCTANYELLTLNDKVYDFASGDKLHRKSPADKSLFEKHLSYPRPMEKSTKISREKLPSAISSAAWRDYYKRKELEKEEKENAKKKRRENAERKKLEKQKNTKVPKRGRVLKNKEENQKHYQKCGLCAAELDSDAENDEEKNVGCDACPRWFHLKCTKFCGREYDDIVDEDFKCDVCDP